MRGESAVLQWHDSSFMPSRLQDVVARDYGVPYWHGATSLLDEERGVFV